VRRVFKKGKGFFRDAGGGLREGGGVSSVWNTERLGSVCLDGSLMEGKKKGSRVSGGSLGEGGMGYLRHPRGEKNADILFK